MAASSADMRSELTMLRKKGVMCSCLEMVSRMRKVKVNWMRRMGPYKEAQAERTPELKKSSFL